MARSGGGQEEREGFLAGSLNFILINNFTSFPPFKSLYTILSCSYLKNNAIDEPRGSLISTHTYVY